VIAGTWLWNVLSAALPEVFSRVIIQQGYRSHSVATSAHTAASALTTLGLTGTIEVLMDLLHRGLSPPAGSEHRDHGLAVLLGITAQGSKGPRDGP
jgi:hypothetical protein